MGKTAIAIVNLPPRKMMGIDSEGMLISAVHEDDGHGGSAPADGRSSHPGRRKALLIAPKWLVVDSDFKNRRKIES